MGKTRIRIDDVAADVANELTEKDMMAIRGGLLPASPLLTKATKGKVFKEVVIPLY